MKEFLPKKDPRTIARRASTNDRKKAARKGANPLDSFEPRRVGVTHDFAAQ
jgi:hypothetical protein